MQSALLRSETKEIQGHTYTVRVLNVAQGREAFVRLQRLLGPALGELIEGGSRGGIARALAGLSAQLTTQDLEWFCATFGAVTSVKWQDESGAELVISLAKPEQQNQIFAGRFLAMFEWLEFAIETNYADFLGKLRSLLDQGQSAQRLMRGNVAETVPTPTE